MEMGSGASLAAGKGNQRITSGAHWSDGNGNLAAYALHPDYYRTLNGTYVVYRLEWTPSSLSTWVIEDSNADIEIDYSNGDENGFLVWKMDINTTETICPYCTEFHQPHFLILNLAVGGRYTTVAPGGGESSSSSSASSGCDSSSSASSSGECTYPSRTDVSAPLPATMSVDWVRVIQNGYSTVTLPKSKEPMPTVSPSSSSSTTTMPPSPAPTTYRTTRPTARGGTSSYDDYDTDSPTLEPTPYYYFSADRSSGSFSSSKSSKSGSGKGGSGKSGKSSKSSKSSHGDTIYSQQYQEFAYSGSTTNICGCYSFIVLLLTMMLLFHGGTE